MISQLTFLVSNTMLGRRVQVQRNSWSELQEEQLSPDLPGIWKCRGAAMYVDVDEGDLPSEKVDKLGVLRPLSLPSVGTDVGGYQKCGAKSERKDKGWGQTGNVTYGRLQQQQQITVIFKAQIKSFKFCVSDLITQPFTVSVSKD